MQQNVQLILCPGQTVAGFHKPLVQHIFRRLRCIPFFPIQEQPPILVQNRKAQLLVLTKLLCFGRVPSMALILLVKVQSQVFTAKCSEPQAGISNGMGEGSGVAKFLSLRTET